MGFDNLERAGGLHSLNFAAAAVEVAHHRAHKFLGLHNFHVHDRLEQTGIDGFEGIAEGMFAGDLEGHTLGIHEVLFAVVKIHLHVHYQIEAGTDIQCYRDRHYL